MAAGSFVQGMEWLREKRDRFGEWVLDLLARKPDGRLPLRELHDAVRKGPEEFAFYANYDMHTFLRSALDDVGIFRIEYYQEGRGHGAYVRLA